MRCVDSHVVTYFKLIHFRLINPIAIKYLKYCVQKLFLIYFVSSSRKTILSKYNGK